MLTRHLPRLLAATALTAALAVPAMAQETINLRAWTIGPDEASEPRAMSRTIWSPACLRRSSTQSG
jgi:hypothetical protein